MPIDRLDFDNVSEADLTELITTQVPEGLRIEYKRDLYGNSDKDKQEALKDISAFANAFGGHLIIGIEEQNGFPTTIPGIPTSNPDNDLLRLEQLVLSGIEPRIQGIRMRSIQLNNSAFCFVLRVPRSWHPPHRVRAQNVNRFWIRNSSGVHEASIEELRTLFTLAASALDRIRQFRHERLEEIHAQRGSIPLQGNGRLILHIVPLAAMSSSWQVDLEIVAQNSHLFPPMQSTGGMARIPRFNFEGFINEYPGVSDFGYTQIFRNGVLEATRASIIHPYNGMKTIPAIDFEQYVFEVLTSYFKGLQDIGVPPPLVFMLTLEGVEEAYYFVPNYFPRGNPVYFRHSVMSLPECIINEYGAEIDYHRAVKPAFDALWNAAGYPSAQTFSPDGQWMGNQRRH